MLFHILLLNDISEHINLADLIAILGSIDSALGSVDIRAI